MMSVLVPSGAWFVTSTKSAVAGFDGSGTVATKLTVAGLPLVIAEPFTVAVKFTEPDTVLVTVIV